MAGYDSETDGEHRLKVFLDQAVTYVQSRRAIEFLATGVWAVTMSSGFDGSILRSEKPDAR